MPSISRRLAEWVAALRFEDLPPQVVDRASGFLLQGMTSALLGYGTPDAKRALRVAIEEGAAGGCTALVGGQRLTRADAAYVNAEMMLSGGKWDTFRMVTHPGCAVLPAALAVAESTACPGSTLLTAIVAGYEVMCRMAADFVPTVMARGFHAGPVFGIFGAAVAAAKIAGLDAGQVHGALAQCVNLASGNLEGARGGGRSVREGAAVRNALLAVALARQGGRSADFIFEGPAGFYHAYAGASDGRLTHSFDGALRADLDAITRGLGQEWRLLETFFRIYSTPGYNVAHVDVTAALCERDGIRAEHVDRVECVVNWLETQYPSPAFPSRRTDLNPGRERPHYYAAYAILTRGFPVTKDVGRGIGEPDPAGLDDLMSRVQVTSSHTQPLFAPRITIFTRDGVAHSLQGSGLEFALVFDQLAARLAPLADVVPIGGARYIELVDACRRIGAARGVGDLVRLSCVE